MCVLCVCAKKYAGTSLRNVGEEGNSRRREKILSYFYVYRSFATQTTTLITRPDCIYSHIMAGYLVEKLVENIKNKLCIKQTFGIQRSASIFIELFLALLCFFSRVCAFAFRIRIAAGVWFGSLSPPPPHTSDTSEGERRRLEVSTRSDI